MKRTHKKTEDKMPNIEYFVILLSHVMGEDIVVEKFKYSSRLKATNECGFFKSSKFGNSALMYSVDTDAYEVRVQEEDKWKKFVDALYPHDFYAWFEAQKVGCVFDPKFIVGFHEK